MKTDQNFTSTELETTETVNATKPAPTLEMLLEPLLSLMNEKFQMRGLGYRVADYAMLGELEIPDHQVHVELDADHLSEPAKQVLATILWKTGSSVTWSGETYRGSDPVKSPLRFRLVTQCVHVESRWEREVRLFVDYDTDGELDCKAAKRQIDHLVAFLKEPANLVELDSEPLSLF